MDIITINLSELYKWNLNSQEYLTLLFLYVTREKPKDYEEFIKSFGTVSLPHMKRLEEKGFIKIPDMVSPELYELREPTRNLFEGEKDLFVTWLLTFPVKTPRGRYLSPVGEDTVVAKKLKAKWKAKFGVDTIKMKRVIDILQAEVNWRKKNGTMEFIHNAETWLNQGDWEKYEYLLVSYKASKERKNEDFI